MKKRRIIISVIAPLIAAITLIGSTGVTLIMHNCQVCNNNYLMTGMFLSPSEPDDNCCDAAGKHDHSSSPYSMKDSSCHFQISKLKVVNYTASEQVLNTIPAESPVKYIQPPLYPASVSIQNTGDFHNKHGGRFLINTICQIIS